MRFQHSCKRYWKCILLTSVSLTLSCGGVTYWYTAGFGKPAAYAAPAVWDPDSALAELRAGNLRFMRSSRTHSVDTSHDAELRQQLAHEQHPFAAVLCCSDSRVCPEFIFDQRSGSIFDIRNAGNVVDDDVLASLEYAVEHLHVPLIVVMGHKRCGAIEAVFEAGDNRLHDHLHALQTHMSGLRRHMPDQPHKHDSILLDRLSKENARQQALAVYHESDFLKSAVDNGLVRLLYAVYDMETGLVDYFEIATNRAAPGFIHSQLIRHK
jgi:carbonic anhydrase